MSATTVQPNLDKSVNTFFQEHEVENSGCVLLNTNDEGDPTIFLFRDKEGVINYTDGSQTFEAGHLGMGQLWEAICWSKGVESRLN
jgi:hypothetical protein